MPELGGKFPRSKQRDSRMNRKHLSGSPVLRDRRLHLGRNPGRTRSGRSTLPQRPPVTPGDADWGRPLGNRRAPPELPSAPTFAKQKEAGFGEGAAGSPRGRAPPASPLVSEPPAAPPSASEHCLERVCARSVPGRGRCRLPGPGGRVAAASAAPPPPPAVAPPAQPQPHLRSPCHRPAPPAGGRAPRPRFLPEIHAPPLPHAPDGGSAPSPRLGGVRPPSERPFPPLSKEGPRGSAGASFGV